METFNTSETKELTGLFKKMNTSELLKIMGADEDEGKNTLLNTVGENTLLNTVGENEMDQNFNYLTSSLQIIVCEYCQLDDLFRLMCIKKFKHFADSISNCYYGDKLKQQCIDILTTKEPIKPYPESLKEDLNSNKNEFKSDLNYYNRRMRLMEHMSKFDKIKDDRVNDGKVNDGKVNDDRIKDDRIKDGKIKDDCKIKEDDGRVNDGRIKDDNKLLPLYIYMSYICKDKVHMPHTPFAYSMYLLIKKHFDEIIYKQLPEPLPLSKWTLLPQTIFSDDWFLSFGSFFNRGNILQRYAYHSRHFSLNGIDTFNNLIVYPSLYVDYDLKRSALAKKEEKLSLDSKSSRNIVGAHMILKLESTGYDNVRPAIYGRLIYCFYIKSRDEWIVEEKFNFNSDTDEYEARISSENLEKLILDGVIPASVNYDDSDKVDSDKVKSPMSHCVTDSRSECVVSTDKVKSECVASPELCSTAMASPELKTKFKEDKREFVNDKDKFKDLLVIVCYERDASKDGDTEIEDYDGEGDGEIGDGWFDGW